ncbi:trypsin-like peptidase domain-containing protein [Candidatus Babeliales bacterium]|nr:trypsin-like peptidase domain-containing protein [Candidatus Babeliales bacterium]
MIHVKKSIRFFIFTVLITILGLCFGFYYLYKKQINLIHYLELVISQQSRDKVQKSFDKVPKILTDGVKTTTSWLDVQKHAKDTVVQIFTQVSKFNWLEPYKTPLQYATAGSGFFINDKGYLVTNFHVVSQASSVKIQIPSFGREQFDVDIIGVCPDRDLALLKLTDESLERIKKDIGKIPYLEFGNSDLILRTQEILALGYPLGQERLKSTLGIVSGRERAGFIQITAPLNPGNSGGPSLDSEGKIVGINFAGVLEAQNIGYIIPINEVKSAIKDLYKVKLLRKPILGCIFTVATSDMVKYFGNPLRGGWYIAKVFENTTLEKVGVKENDMLYEVNGYKLDLYGDLSVPWSDDKISLLDFLNRFTVGDDIHFVIYRKGKRKDFRFKLDNKYLPPIRKIYPEWEPEAIDYEIIGGMVVMSLTLNHVAILLSKAPSMTKYLRLEEQHEPVILVTHIFPNSQAYKSRILTPSAIIDEVNDKKISTLDDFRQAVKEGKKTGFITIKTKDKMFGVLPVNKILQDEDMLASRYFYKKSKLLDYLK